MKEFLLCIALFVCAFVLYSVMNVVSVQADEYSKVKKVERRVNG